MRITKSITKRLKIAGATATAVFSLASVFSATMAWFASNNSVTAEGMAVTAVDDSVIIDDITLCKFSYPVSDGETIYLNPSEGSVDTYSFVEGEGHNRFEDDEGNPQTMNLFDPVLIELGTDLRDLYCDTIYIVTISANRETAGLQVFADLLSKSRVNDTDLFLSDCVDFDIYTTSDLEAVTGKGYYPSHIKNVEETTLTGYDEIFYKIAYLSSTTNNHAHFYGNGQKPDRINIHDPVNLKTLNFVDNTTTFYIHMNYAPSQLERYAASLANGNRTGIFDYTFTVDLA